MGSARYTGSYRAVKTFKSTIYLHSGCHARQARGAGGGVASGLSDRAGGEGSIRGARKRQSTGKTQRHFKVKD
jgi:hypothetical protein